MGTSTWSGPIKAGSIKDTSGTTVGKDVKNVGFAVMVQTADITQAGTTAAAKTGIVIPANSQIINIKLVSTVVFSGGATTISLGTTVAANELVVAGVTSGALGIATFTPGTTLALINKWNNVGTTDVAIWALSANTGTGVARLIVEYIQANN